MKFLMQILIISSLLMIGTNLYAQKGGVRGTVYEKESGEPIIGALLYIQGTNYAAFSEEDGSYTIVGIPEGDYTLVSQYIGFDSVSVAVTINKNMVIHNFWIEESTNKMDIIEITAEQEAARNDVRISVVRITPKDIKKIPAAGGEADFAQYLQVLPGIVSTGDQGGQLYIRGGAPVQNKVLLDGMTLFNAFHSIGFFSVFETDIIRTADIYTGGFSAKYGGRSSAVVDIKTRGGNKKRLAGMLNINPFVVKGIIEGPIIKLNEKTGSSLSFLGTIKHSYLRESSSLFYKYANEAGVLPYNFTDANAKISFNSANGNHLNIFGFYHSDEVKYNGLANYDWNAAGGGLDYKLVPEGAKFVLTGVLAYSTYAAKFLEEGNNSKIRKSNVGSFNGTMNFAYYLPKARSINFGVEINGMSTQFEYANSGTVAVTQGGKNPQSNIEAGLYAHFKGRFGPLVIEPSVRMQAYASLGEVRIEPRLGLKWNITNWLRFKAAGGMYSQNLISSVDERDIVNLFVGFLGGPNDGVFRLKDGIYTKSETRLQTSIHAIGGFEIDAGRNLKINIEPYYKWFPQIVAINRNLKAGDRDHTFLAEVGAAYGLDISTTFEKKQLYLYAAYSLGYVTRNDGVQEYYAHFDRRHNFNFVGSYQFKLSNKSTAESPVTKTDAKAIKNKTKYPFEVGIRWNLGSGFPFNRTQGFYANQTFNNGLATNYLTDNNAPNTNLGVIYEDQLNLGRLPYYHRLDISFKYTLDIIKHMKLMISASVTNTYNRQNIFYFDRIEYKRINQLPIMPALNLNLKF